MKSYDDFYVSYETEDSKFIVHEIKGAIDFNDTNKCITKRNSILSNIKESLNDAIKDEWDYIKDPAQDKSGNSKNYSVDLDIEGGKIRVYCLMWSNDIKNEKKWESHLAITIYDNIFRNFLMNEAYD